MSERCDGIQEQLARGQALSADEGAHVADCVDCARAELDAALRAPELLPLEGLLPAVQADIAQEQGPLGWWRSQTTGVRRGVGLFVVLGVGLVFGLVRPRVDLSVFPMPRMIALLVIYGVVGGLASWGALGSARRPVVRPALATGGLLVAVVVSVGLALLPPAHSAHAASVGGGGVDFLPRALACLATGLGVALPGVLLLGLGARATGHSLRAPWVLGAVAGALGGQLALQLHCPLVGSGHRLAGHALLVVVLGVVTWVLAGRRRSS